MSSRFFLLTIVVALHASPVLAGETAWSHAREALRPTGKGIPAEAVAYDVNSSTLATALSAAPHANAGRAVELVLPGHDGSGEVFRFYRTAVLSPELQRARPQVQTFTGSAVGDPTSMVSLTLTPDGMFFRVSSPRGGWMGSSLSSAHPQELWVWRNEDSPGYPFTCLVEDEDQAKADSPPAELQAAWGTQLRTYRLALSATGELTQELGSVSAVETMMISLVNSMNVAFRRELAIEMEIIHFNIYNDPATDPFPNGTVVDGTIITQNHNDLNSQLGSNGYDIGHLLGYLPGTNGYSGIAGLGSICSSSGQGRGASMHGIPSSGNLYLLALHEFGHQLGAPHSFNGTAGNCGGNRTFTTAYEIGSGVTIMSYAGTCGSENVEPDKYDYYNQGSLDRIQQEISGGCGTTVPSGNTEVTVDAGPDLTIPRETAFVLSATASDAESTSLTYSWEQHDLGSASPPYGPSTGPLFRNFDQTIDPVRSVPFYDAYRNGWSTDFEFLPTVDRNLTFRVSVRDNQAPSSTQAYDTIEITVAGDPFVVTSPDGGEMLEAGAPTTVTWDVGGGSVASDVRILQSLDNAQTWQELEASTPNDGSASVTLDCVETVEARIRVEAVGNIFFDIGDADFETTPEKGVPVVTCPAPFSVTATGPNGIDKDDPALVPFFAGASVSDNCDPNPFLTDSAPQTIPEGTMTIAFIATDASGNSGFCTTDLTVEPQATGVPVPRGVTALLGVHPNPFNPRAVVRFQLSREQQVHLELLDVRGRSVAVLHDGALAAGPHEIDWDGSGMASGVYLLRLRTEEGLFTSRAALLK